MEGWKYYNYAMLPSCKPHEDADLSVFEDKKLWKKPGFKKSIFARYTTNWDCQEDTGWYWCLIDKPFDISKIKAKYRYEIKKGIANYDVKVIEPTQYCDELYEVCVSSAKGYPEIYRNIPSKEVFEKSLPTWKKTFAAFDKIGGGTICGYIIMVEREEVLYYSGHKSKTECEKNFVNHALIYGMLNYYNDRLSEGSYIVDGERNIYHITNHQDFLCKKFNFRKVNCKLNMVYRPSLKPLIKFLYHLRRIMRKLDKISIIHKINGVILLEEISRKY